MSELIIGGILGAVAGSAATALRDRYDYRFSHEVGHDSRGVYPVGNPKAYSKEHQRTSLGSFWTGRSVCRSCHRPLRWFELIPVVSWLTQRGRCRSCTAPIGWPVLWVELGSTLAGVGFASLDLSNWFLAATLLSLVPLGALVLVDLEEQLLPDRLLIAAAPFVLLVAVTRFTPVSVADLFLGLIVSGGTIAALWLVTRGRGMGLGDAKLAVLLGFGLGFSNSLVFLVLSFTSGAVVGLLLITAGRSRFGQRLAFGPFLITGYLATLVVGPAIVTWYSGM